MILTIIIVLYVIVYYVFETSKQYEYYYKKTELHTDLDIDNITIIEIGLLETKIRYLNHRKTKTLCHYDILLKDINNNYYIEYVYGKNDSYNRYIELIDINNLKRKFKPKYFNKIWSYDLPNVYYKIKPCTLRLIDNLQERLMKNGYHVLKYNCQHIDKMLINVLTKQPIFNIEHYSMLKSFINIALFE
jgi:hypothetical protein